MHKIIATIYRDFKEYLANYSVFSLFLIPLVMAMIYRLMGQNVNEAIPDAMVFIIIGTILASVSTNVPLMLFADEKEHGMIRMVIKNKGDLFLVMMGRSVLVIITTVLLIIVSLILVNNVALLNLSLSLGLFLAILIFTGLGITAGLRSKLESTSTVAGVIILFFLGMTPIVETMGITNIAIVRFLVDLTPVYQLMAIQNNAGVTPYVILLLWLLVTVFSVYRSLNIFEES